MRYETITYPQANIKPAGIILIIHGMCEHRRRYTHVMKKFNSYGFICAAFDLRGHGENIENEDGLGYFGENGDKLLVSDVHEYILHLKREYPGMPVILVAHSMGSLIARVFIKKYSKDIDALILSGSPSENRLASPAKKLIRVMAFFMGWHHRSNFLHKMSLGVYDKAFQKEGIVNSWICSDNEVVTRYNNDPECGFNFTLNGYYTLMDLMIKCYSRMGWHDKDTSLPVMFISGEDDPCKIDDKSFKNAVMNMKHSGFSNTYFKLYPGMRHEIFNEPDNDEVYRDIIKFLEIKTDINIDED